MEIPVVITGTLICYYLYYYFAGGFLVQKFFPDTVSAKDQVTIFLFKKVSGFIFLGLIPSLYYCFFISGNVLSEFGFRFSGLTDNALLLAGLSLLVLGVIFLVNKFNGPVKDKPQIRLEKWTGGVFLLNCLGWIIYLVGYETLFRGVLLISCYHAFGMPVAIAINLAIYSAIHMVNGKGEALGALVFGFISCLLTIKTGTILISIILHIVLALSTDYFAIVYSPAMQFIGKSQEKRR